MRARLSTMTLTAIGFAVALAGQAVAQTRPVYRVEEAMLLAQRTGRPILTIAGTTG